MSAALETVADRRSPMINEDQPLEVIVTSPRRLVRGRLQSLKVEVRSATPGRGWPSVRRPLVVRPSLPGVLVSPVERSVEGVLLPVEVTFLIAPVASGKLPNGKVELLGAGSHPLAIDVPLRVQGHGLAFSLLALAVFVPLAFAPTLVTRLVSLVDAGAGAAWLGPICAAGLLALALFAWPRALGRLKAVAALGPAPAPASTRLRAQLPTGLSPLDPDEEAQLRLTRT